MLVCADDPAVLAVTSALLDAARERHRRGDVDGAGPLYRRMTAANPAAGEAWQGLALIRMEAQGGDAAVGLLERALSCGDGVRYRMWFHLGVAHVKAERLEASIQALVNAVHAEPHYENSSHHLIAVLQRLNRSTDVAQMYTFLGRKRFQRGAAEQALEAYEAALAADPAYVPALLAKAPLLRFFGRAEEAAAAYRETLRLNPANLGARLGLCASQLRIIYRTMDELAVSRTAYLGALAHLHGGVLDADQPTLAAAEYAIGDSKPFYLNYHGVNDRDAQTLYGGAVHKIMGAYLPAYMGPPPRRRGGGKLRVGLISTLLYEHSVSKLFVGWAERLDRSRFDVFCYHLGEGFDAYTERFRAGAAGFTHGLPDTRAWAEAIRADELDALIYLDIGMSGLEVRLAALRLAPVQCVTWGHPVTTGLPNMDYFLSSALMEPFNGQDHYTETLAALPNLSVYYEPILYDDMPLSRQDLGLDASDRVFTCCQSLYKYLPVYDRVFPDIAQRLPAARFLFLRHHLPEVTAIFEQRMETAFAAAGLRAADHCRMLERIPRDQFGSFLRCGDVYLDSIGWSGGNTTLEAMAHDRPAVTLAADLMRGRHSTGILRRLGLDALVAEDLAGYVDLAVDLAANTGRRQEISRLIAARKHRLYRDDDAARGLEEFLIAAVAKGKIRP